MVGVVTVTHAFVSMLEDSPDAAALGELVPSNWNDDHVVEGAAPLDSPAFVNTPTAPTPPPGDTSNRLATMAALAAATASPSRVNLTSAVNYNVADGIALVIARCAAPAAFAVTLPLSTDANAPDEITVKDRMLSSGGAGAGTYNITVQGEGGETIDGVASTKLDVDNVALRFCKVRDASGDITGEGWEIR